MATSLQPIKSWKKNPVEVEKGRILAGWAQGIGLTKKFLDWEYVPFT